MDTERMKQLHDRATRGKVLLPDEQVELDAWYSQQDSQEAEILSGLSRNMPLPDLSAIFSLIDVLIDFNIETEGRDVILHDLFPGCSFDEARTCRTFLLAWLKSRAEAGVGRPFILVEGSEISEAVMKLVRSNQHLANLFYIEQTELDFSADIAPSDISAIERHVFSNYIVFAGVLRRGYR